MGSILSWVTVKNLILRATQEKALSPYFTGLERLARNDTEVEGTLWFPFGTLGKGLACHWSGIPHVA